MEGMVVTVKFFEDLNTEVMLGSMDVIRAVYQKGGYRDMAQVDTSDLEVAYASLQNGVRSDSWTLLPPDGVTPLQDPLNHNGRKVGHRSAMVGDIFDLDGTLYVCCATGFTRLE